MARESTHERGLGSSQTADRAVWDVLRLSARLDPSAEDDRRLAGVAARLNDWQELATAAEAHGLTPLVSYRLARAGISLPIDAERQIAALAIHHRRTNRIRFRALAEILDALDHAAIPVLVLKGAALAHMIYPSPGLRPLTDIDLLVESRAASSAREILGRLGFVDPGAAPSRGGAAHHHLPGLIKISDGYPVRVEIHRDALAADTRETLSMSRLTSAPQPFSMDGRAARTLGHADMLYHLCRHAAECALQLRLVWVADIVGYATRYRLSIPWDDVREQYPFVINALSLLHLVTALPPELMGHVTPANGEGLRGIGVSCKPLSAIIKRHRRVGDIWRDIFDPSDWWLRLYYGLDDRSSLAWHRRVTHPLRVAYWLARRAGASTRRWTGSRN